VEFNLATNEVFSPIPVNSTVTVSNDGELSRF
jgi:hypothetical protein